MDPKQWSEEEARAFLAGMKTVATVRGTRSLDPLASEMLDAVRRHVLHARTDLDTLPEWTPAELAAQVQNEAGRQELVQFLILMPYLPMQVDPEQVAVVDEIAGALGTSPQTLDDLHRVRDERLKRLAVDFTRRGLSEYSDGGGVIDQVKLFLHSLRQFAGDKKVAERYRRLEELPEGSLGRTLFEFYRARGFPLPGERKSFSDLAITHDCCHIMAGFNTDMNGEISVAGFEAGLFQRSFGFELLLEVILDFHLGKTFTTAGLLPPGKGHFDPEDVMLGYERGVASKVNLLVDWDFWEVVDQPVVDLRARYGLPEIPGPVLLPPPPAIEAAPQHQEH